MLLIAPLTARTSRSAQSAVTRPRAARRARRAAIGAVGIRPDSVTERMGFNEDALTDQALDVLQTATLLTRAKRNSNPVKPGAGRAPDAVHIRLRHVGEIIIDDMGHRVDIDAARRNVGRHEKAHIAVLKRLQRARSLALALIAVDRHGVDAGLIKPGDNAVSLVFHAHKDDDTLHRSVRRQMGKKILLAALLAENHALAHALGRGGRGRYGNLDRLVENFAGKTADLCRHGGGE